MRTKGKFEIIKRKDEEYQFNLLAPNGEIILTSEGYTTLANCKKGIDSVKKNSHDQAMFERLNAKTGDKVYFVLKATNGKVIGNSQMYANYASRENGILSVQEYAHNAEVIETF